MVKPVILLGSNSPRRRELLAISGWEFSVRPAEVDESPLPGEAPDRYVLRLAKSKALACARSGAEAALILAADTTVSLDGDILGKPADAQDAAAMLRRLRGRSHQVYTGIALLRPSDGKGCRELCATEVPMRSYAEAEIEAYVASGDPLDKAGAYAIQHAGFHPVEGLQGCFASVMGLPLCHLQRGLRTFGLAPAKDLPAGCQEHLNYVCPVSAAILAGGDAG